VGTVSADCSSALRNQVKSRDTRKLDPDLGIAAVDPQWGPSLERSMIATTVHWQLCDRNMCTLSVV
jgi:hypothetical protein